MPYTFQQIESIRKDYNKVEALIEQRDILLKEIKKMDDIIRKLKGEGYLPVCFGNWDKENDCLLIGCDDSKQSMCRLNSLKLC